MNKSCLVTAIVVLVFGMMLIFLAGGATALYFVLNSKPATSRQRVLDFIRTDEAWERKTNISDSTDDKDKATVPPSVEANFENAKTRPDLQPATPPNHTVIGEKIITVKEKDDTADITTQMDADDSSSEEYLYHLHRTDEVWKITTFEPFYTKVGDAGPDRWQVDSNQFVTKLSLDEGVAFDFLKAFNPDPNIKLRPDQKTVTRLVNAGELALPSGKLVLYPGTDYNSEAKPFALTVPPGNWPVYLSEVDGGIGAILIKFQDFLKLKAYVPALDLGEEKYLTFPTAGYPVLADAGARHQESARDLEKIAHMDVEAEKTDWLWLNLMNKHDGIIISTMDNNDGHPYWGVDSEGKAVCLVVDFTDYGVSTDQECTLPFAPDAKGQNLEDDTLTAAGIELRLDHEGAGYQVTVKETGNGTLSEVIIYDDDHHILDSTKNHDVTVDEDKRTFRLDIPEGATSGEVKIKWSTWTSNLGADAADQTAPPSPTPAADK